MSFRSILLHVYVIAFVASMGWEIGQIIIKSCLIMFHGWLTS